MRRFLIFIFPVVFLCGCGGELKEKMQRVNVEMTEKSKQAEIEFESEKMKLAKETVCIDGVVYFKSVMYRGYVVLTPKFTKDGKVQLCGDN